MIRRIYFETALLMLLASCRSVKYVPVDTVRNDSVYLTVYERDSIHVHDSINVREKGDTIFVDKWHMRYRDRILHDTAYIEREKVVQVPYPVKKELTWWQKTKMNIGMVSMYIILPLFATIIWIIKKKGGQR